MEIQEDEASDLLETIEQSLRQRHFGPAVRLEVDLDMPDDMVRLLADNLEVELVDVYPLHRPLGMSSLMALMDLNRPDLKDTPFVPAVPPQLRDLKTAAEIFAAIRRQDILLHHPYDSFTPVLDFIRAAAIDPDVLAIKQTLYRVGQNAPVVRALLDAQRNGKQVAVSGGAQGAFRRGEQHRLGEGAGSRRGARRLWPGWPENAQQDHAGGAQGGRRAAPLPASCHGQLQRRDRRHLHRSRPADLRSWSWARMPPTCSTR